MNDFSDLCDIFLISHSMFSTEDSKIVYEEDN